MIIGTCALTRDSYVVIAIRCMRIVLVTYTHLFLMILQGAYPLHFAFYYFQLLRRCL